MKYSIVIPAYNEGERIVATLDKVLAYIAGEPEFAGKTELLVVNDGSRDRTADEGHDQEHRERHDGRRDGDEDAEDRPEHGTEVEAPREVAGVHRAVS